MSKVSGVGDQIALTIAGLDPTSGAGITADLKVFAAHGIYGVAAPSALTVQSTLRVERVEPVAAELLANILLCLDSDLPAQGIKIGMLATSAHVDVVAEFLASRPGPAVPVVLDPVIQSSSGHRLLEADGVERLRTRLLPRVDCVTPNTAELALLSGLEIDPKVAGQVEAASAALAAEFPTLAVIATGGHLASPDDYVLPPAETQVPGRWLHGIRVDTRATHGTGCAYSSALLCGLIGGLSLFEAAVSAKAYVFEALQAATPIGSGGGAMHHLYRFDSQRSFIEVKRSDQG